MSSTLRDSCVSSFLERMEALWLEFCPLSRLEDQAVRQHSHSPVSIWMCVPLGDAVLKSMADEKVAIAVDLLHSTRVVVVRGYFSKFNIRLSHRAK